MKKCKIFIACFLAIVLVIFSSVTALAAKKSRLVDNADLLSDAEESAILSKLDAKSEEFQCDIVIVTVESTGYKSAEEFADEFYDYNGYGFGEDSDGILFLVNLNEGSWAVSTCGEGEYIIDDFALDEIEEICIPNLSAGNYYSAFINYINITEEYIVDYNTFPLFTNLVISIIVGFVVSLVVVSVMKGKLKSVRKQLYAGVYTKENSFEVTQSRDIYLYSHVTRTAKPKNNSHSSSSGRSHGGRSGSF